MENSKETICGELLYEFMVHEKGFKTSGRWKNCEQEKLRNDFSVMKQLIQLIELEREILFGEIKEIILYLDSENVYVGNLLQRRDSDVMKFCGKANAEIDSKIFKLIEEGENIILENQRTKGLKRVISEKKRKEQMWLILMGLHNLPRIYLDGEGEFDDLKKWLLSPEEALAYSSSYLNALKESQIKMN